MIPAGPPSTPATVGVGDQIPLTSRAVTREQIRAYADVSGDHNPIHLDDDFARSVGLPGAIAHGMLSMGIVAEALAEWAGGRANLEALSCRFSKPLQPGETLTCTGTVLSIDADTNTLTLELSGLSPRGERVLSNGRARVRRLR